MTECRIYAATTQECLHPRSDASRDAEVAAVRGDFSAGVNLYCSLSDGTVRGRVVLTRRSQEACFAAVTASDTAGSDLLETYRRRLQEAIEERGWKISEQESRTVFEALGESLAVSEQTKTVVEQELRNASTRPVRIIVPTHEVGTHLFRWLCTRPAGVGSSATIVLGIGSEYDHLDPDVVVEVDSTVEEIETAEAKPVGEGAVKERIEHTLARVAEATASPTEMAGLLRDAGAESKLDGRFRTRRPERRRRLFAVLGGLAGGVLGAGYTLWQRGTTGFRRTLETSVRFVVPPGGQRIEAIPAYGLEVRFAVVVVAACVFAAAVVGTAYKRSRVENSSRTDRETPDQLSEQERDVQGVEDDSLEELRERLKRDLAVVDGSDEVQLEDVLRSTVGRYGIAIEANPRENRLRRYTIGVGGAVAVGLVWFGLFELLPTSVVGTALGWLTVVGMVGIAGMILRRAVRIPTVGGGIVQVLVSYLAGSNQSSASEREHAVDEWFEARINTIDGGTTRERISAAQNLNNKIVEYATELRNDKINQLSQRMREAEDPTVKRELAEALLSINRFYEGQGIINRIPRKDVHKAEQLVNRTQQGSLTGTARDGSVASSPEESPSAEQERPGHESVTGSEPDPDENAASTAPETQQDRTRAQPDISLDEVSPTEDGRSEAEGGEERAQVSTGASAKASPDQTLPVPKDKTMAPEPTSGSPDQQPGQGNLRHVEAIEAWRYGGDEVKITVQPLVTENGVYVAGQFRESVGVDELKDHSAFQNDSYRRHVINRARGTGNQRIETGGIVTRLSPAGDVRDRFPVYDSVETQPCTQAHSVFVADDGGGMYQFGVDQTEGAVRLNSFQHRDRLETPLYPVGTGSLVYGTAARTVLIDVTGRDKKEYRQTLACPPVSTQTDMNLIFEQGVLVHLDLQASGKVADTRHIELSSGERVTDSAIGGGRLFIGTTAGRVITRDATTGADASDDLQVSGGVDHLFVDEGDLHVVAGGAVHLFDTDTFERLRLISDEAKTVAVRPVRAGDELFVPMDAGRVLVVHDVKRDVTCERIKFASAPVAQPVCVAGDSAYVVDEDGVLHAIPVSPQQ